MFPPVWTTTALVPPVVPRGVRTADALPVVVRQSIWESMSQPAFHLCQANRSGARAEMRPIRSQPPTARWMLSAELYVEVRQPGEVPGLVVEDLVAPVVDVLTEGDGMAQLDPVGGHSPTGGRDPGRRYVEVVADFGGTT